MNNVALNACIAVGIIALLVGIVIGCYIGYTMSNSDSKKTDRKVSKMFDERRQIPLSK